MVNNINELMYSFRDSNVRVVMKDNEPWFVMNDVCEVLDIKNPRDAFSRLEEHEKGVGTTDGLNGKKQVNIINEYGLYSLIFTSRKPEAKEFKNWVTTEILPSIRKHGIYATEDVTKQVLDNPQFMIELLQSLQSEREERKKAEVLINEQKHKVLLAESIENSNDLIGIGELAKIITQNGYAIGQNTLFKWLRSNKYIMYANGQNVPTQYAMERGWFRVIERTINNGKDIKISITTKVTGKGQLYFVNKFLKDK